MYLGTTFLRIPFKPYLVQFSTIIWINLKFETILIYNFFLVFFLFRLKFMHTITYCFIAVTMFKRLRKIILYNVLLSCHRLKIPSKINYNYIYSTLKKILADHFTCCQTSAAFDRSSRVIKICAKSSWRVDVYNEIVLVHMDGRKSSPRSCWVWLSCCYSWIFMAMCN